MGGGDRGDGICPDGTCCSRYGWCGTTPEYCDGVVAVVVATSPPSAAPVADPTTGPPAVAAPPPPVAGPTDPPVAAPTPDGGPTAADPTGPPAAVAVAVAVAPTTAPTTPPGGEGEEGTEPPAAAAAAADDDDGTPPVPPTAMPTTAAGSGGWAIGTSSFPPTTSTLSGPIRTEGLTVTLSGIDGINSVSDWGGTTSEYFEDVYRDERSGGVYDVMVVVTATNVTAIGGANGGRVRRRSENAGVVVAYVQETWYLADDPDWAPDGDFALVPLSTELRRDEYVGRLKSLLGGYEYLTDVSEISVVSSAPSSGADAGDGGGGGSGGSGSGGGAIVGISVVAAAVLLAAIVAGIVRYRKERHDDDDWVDLNNDDVPPTSKGQDVRTASVSSGAVRTTGGAEAKSSSTPSTLSIISQDTPTIGTVDYDYGIAYGGGGDHSLSDAGGTLGSRTRQTGLANLEEDLPTTTAAPPPGGSSNTIFSDDPTFDEAYEDVREVLLDVYAPAGKLGVIIDTPGDGAPMIHFIKDSSPMVDKVRVGDLLVAVDDDDVRAMTAVKVSKLISTKSNNPSRKFTIIRQERKAGPIG
jgi:hypothetical protein